MYHPAPPIIGSKTFGPQAGPNAFGAQRRSQPGYNKPDPVMVSRARTEHGRNRSIITSLHAEVSNPFTGDTDKVPGELALVKRMGEVLHRHFPGHPWAVRVDTHGGIAVIGIPDLLGPNWGMILHLDGDTSDAAVIRAGGEILERFKIPRSTIDVAAYLSAMTLPKIGNYRAKDRHRIPT